MQFIVTTDQTIKRTDELIDYLCGPRLWIPRLDYPDFDEWIQKVYTQLKSESKRAIIALSKGSIVGAVLYQRHAKKHDTLEIKNITVRPDQRGRFLASFMLRNAEIEGSFDFKVSRVVVDTKVRNRSVRMYLMKNGYVMLGTMDLYGLKAGDDVIYQKIIYVSKRNR